MYATSIGDILQTDMLVLPYSLKNNFNKNDINIENLGLDTNETIVGSMLSISLNSLRTFLENEPDIYTLDDIKVHYK